MSLFTAIRWLLPSVSVLHVSLELKSTRSIHSLLSNDLSLIADLDTFVFVLGLVGNCLVVAVICRAPRMRTVTNYFIVISFHHKKIHHLFILKKLKELVWIPVKLSGCGHSCNTFLLAGYPVCQHYFS